MPTAVMRKNLTKPISRRGPETSQRTNAEMSREQEAVVRRLQTLGIRSSRGQVQEFVPDMDDVQSPRSSTCGHSNKCSSMEDLKYLSAGSSTNSSTSRAWSGSQSSGVHVDMSNSWTISESWSSPRSSNASPPRSDSSSTYVSAHVDGPTPTPSSAIEGSASGRGRSGPAGQSRNRGSRQRDRNPSSGARRPQGDRQGPNERFESLDAWVTDLAMGDVEVRRIPRG